MAWFLLLLAGLFEVAWATGLKYSEGFTRPAVTALTLGCMLISFGLLAQALKTIPLGPGYAVWTGIGAVGAAVAGMVLLGESRDVAKLVCIGLIVAGIAGLKVASPGH